MSGVYLSVPEDGYEWCAGVGGEDVLRVSQGWRTGDDFVGVRLRMLRSVREGLVKESDAPFFTSNILMCRSAAVEWLVGLGVEGRFVELPCEEGVLEMFLPGVVIEAMDLDLSGATWRKNGRVLGVSRHCVKRSVVAGLDVFRAAETGVIFFSERAVASWRSLGLRGLEFEPAVLV